MSTRALKHVCRPMHTHYDYTHRSVGRSFGRLVCINFYWINDCVFVCKQIVAIQRRAKQHVFYIWCTGTGTGHTHVYKWVYVNWYELRCAKIPWNECCCRHSSNWSCLCVTHRKSLVFDVFVGVRCVMCVWNNNVGKVETMKKQKKITHKR